MKIARRRLPGDIVQTAVAGAAATGSALLAVHGMPPEAIGAAASLQKILELGIDRARDIFGRAADEFGDPIDELIEALSETGKRQELVIKALEAARFAISSEKQLGLARTIASGAKSADAEADLELFYVRALSELDSSGIALMILLKDPLNKEIHSGSFRQGYLDADMAERRPELAPIIGPTLSRLESIGLAMHQDDPPPSLGLSGPDAHTWSLTQHGVTLLARMGIE